MFLPQGCFKGLRLIERIDVTSDTDIVTFDNLNIKNGQTLTIISNIFNNTANNAKVEILVNGEADSSDWNVTDYYIGGSKYEYTGFNIISRINSNQYAFTNAVINTSFDGQLIVYSESVTYPNTFIKEIFISIKLTKVPNIQTIQLKSDVTNTISAGSYFELREILK